MSDLSGQILGKYEILTPLGSGDIGQVFKGYHRELDRYVAVKIMHRFLAQDPDFLARFRREAQSAAALRHPNIVQVYDFDIAGDRSYMVMELINGQSLDQILKSDLAAGNRWSLARSISLLREVGTALAYAHDQGMVHRDVKPANILIDESGRAVLTDFGLVKMLADHSQPEVGTILGAPDYLAPEQCLGQPGDHRVDIYSMGVLLFLLTTGRLPFIADTPLGTIIKQVNEQPPRPSEINDNLPGWFDKVVLKSLAKTPDYRYQSVEEMLVALGYTRPLVEDPRVDPWSQTMPIRLPIIMPPVEEELPPEPPPQPKRPASPEQKHLQEAIAALEGQRTILGNDVVEAALAPLREKLASLTVQHTVEERKQVTILFADLVGFTAMGDQLDAEEVSDIQQAYFKRCRWAIGRWGGVIEKFIGDAVMAVFGVPTARENDPEMAIRAALDLQAAIQELSVVEPDSPLKPNIPLQLRIGINTGRVVVRFLMGGSGADFAVVGDPVNVANRLESAAPPGDILISQDTYRHVQGIFEFQPQPLLTVKGKLEPLQVYLVKGLRPARFRLPKRGFEGLQTRMIGREIELKALQDARDLTVVDHERQMVTIVGDAGVGKSRLLDEFFTWLELQPEQTRYFKGRARLETRHRPYSLLRDLFAFRFQIEESDAVEVVHLKMERGLVKILGESEQSRMKAHFIGHLFGFDFGESAHLAKVLGDVRQIYDRALMYLVDYFKGVMKRWPAVLLLEDLHWADDSSLDIIERLAGAMDEQRLLIVATARPVLLESRPEWGQEQRGYRRLRLNPLSKQDSRRMVVEVLQKVKELPDALRELIAGKAEGNPFYIEELVKMLVEDGVIVKGEDRWQVEIDRLADVRVPATLTGVLQARLDSLPDEERANLQRAAVVGRIFWDDLVRYLAVRRPAGEMQERRDIFQSLQERELIYRREPSAFLGTQEYIIKHALLRDVAYESILRRVRREYHLLVAEWLLVHGGERIEEYTGFIADHFELAGDSRAVHYLQLAGQKAAAQYAHDEAIDYLSRALKLLSAEDDEIRYRLLRTREAIDHVQGNRAAQAADLALLVELVAQNWPGQQRAEVAIRQGWYANAVGDYGTAVTLAAEAEHWGKQAGAPELVAQARLHAGWALLNQGDYIAACDYYREALEEAKAATAQIQEARSLGGLGHVFYNLGHFDKAHNYHQDALAIRRAIHDRRGEGDSLNNLGRVTRCLGQFAASRQYHQEALIIRRLIGDRQGEADTLVNLGIVARNIGDYPPAELNLVKALNIAREIGDRRIESLALVNWGAVAWDLGDYLTAQRHYNEALTIAQELGDRRGEGLMYDFLGLISRTRGDYVKAREYHRQALNIAWEIGRPEGQAYALTGLGDALTGLHLWAEARSFLKEAIELRQEMGQVHLEMESRASLARAHLGEQAVARAMQEVDVILNYLDRGGLLDGTEEPLHIYLTCIQVLQANQDERLEAVLETAFGWLKQRADKIQDKTARSQFMENVAHHRDIVRLWQARQQ